MHNPQFFFWCFLLSSLAPCLPDLLMPLRVSTEFERNGRLEGSRWGYLPPPPSPLLRLPLPPLKKRKEIKKSWGFVVPSCVGTPALPRSPWDVLRLACRTRLSLLTVVASLLLLATFPLHCIAWLCACAAAAVSMASCFYVVTWKLLQLNWRGCF